MRLGDVGQRVGMDGQEIEIARLDPVQDPLKHLCRQVLGLAGVGGQTYPVGDPVHRVEVGNRPRVRQHPGEADRSVNRRRRQRVLQRRHADQLKDGVNPTRLCLAQPRSDLSVVQERDGAS